MTPRWLLLLAGLAGLALAQTKVVTVLVPPIADNIPDQQIFASVANVKPDATEYVLDIAKTANIDSLLRRLAGATLTYGPATVGIHVEESTAQTNGDSTRFAAYTLNVACSVDQKENFGTCTGQSTTVVGYQSTSATASVSDTRQKYYGISAWKVPITVTAGADRVTADSDASSSTGTSKPTAPSTPATQTESSRSSASTGSPAGTTTRSGGGAGNANSSSRSSASSTSSSTGGVPRVTQQAVYAGVAAVVGGALIL